MFEREPADLIRIAGPYVVDPVVGTSLPAEAPLDRGVVDQVGHVDRQQEIAFAGPPVQLVDDSPAQLALPLRVASPEVGTQGFTNQLVEGEPVAQRLGEGQLAQPLVRRVRVAVGKHRAQQIDRRHPSDRRDRERGKAYPPKLGLCQPAYELAEDLGRLGTWLRLERLS